MAANSDHSVGPWTKGFVYFAGVMMLLAGTFQAIQGLMALINPDFFIVNQQYIVHINIMTWGWIHLILGAIIAFAGWQVFSGVSWARGLGIILAIISAIANFFYIPYYPFWSIVILALDIFVICSLVAFGPREALIP